MDKGPGLVTSKREEAEVTEGGREGFLKKPGCRKKTALVFDALEMLPTCISKPKCSNCWQTTAEPNLVSYGTEI